MKATCATRRMEGGDMDASAIYRRLPGLTEGEVVALALAYHLGEADAHTMRTSGASDGSVRTQNTRT